MFSEFFGVVQARGVLRKIGNKYLLQATISCNAKMTCDLSGEEFVERVTAELNATYIADTHRFLARRASEETAQPYYIREDDTDIDFADEARQELAVALPLKRVAPEHRSRDFGDMFPAYDADLQAKTNENAPDERWAALKNVSFS